MNLKWEIRDNRKKIIIISLIMLFMAITIVYYFPQYLKMVDSGFIGTQADDYQREFQRQTDYSYYLSRNWFDKSYFELLGILAVLLAIGAVVDDKGNKILGIYFVKYSRTQYFLRKTLSQLLILFIIGYAVTICLSLFSKIQGYNIELLRLNLSYVMAFTRVFFIYALALAASTITSSKFLAGTISFLSVIVILYLMPGVLNVFNYMNITLYYTGAKFPLKGFIMTIIVSLPFYVLTYLNIRRIEV